MSWDKKEKETKKDEEMYMTSTADLGLLKDVGSQLQLDISLP